MDIRDIRFAEPLAAPVAAFLAAGTVEAGYWSGDIGVAVKAAVEAASAAYLPTRGDAVEAWLIEMRRRQRGRPAIDVDAGRVALTALIEDYRAKADRGETL